MPKLFFLLTLSIVLSFYCVTGPEFPDSLTATYTIWPRLTIAVSSTCQKGCQLKILILYSNRTRLIFPSMLVQRIGDATEQSLPNYPIFTIIDIYLEIYSFEEGVGTVSYLPTYLLTYLLTSSDYLWLFVHIADSKPQMWQWYSGGWWRMWLRYTRGKQCACVYVHIRLRRHYAYTQRST